MGDRRDAVPRGTQRALLARLDGRCASRVAHLQRIDVALSEIAYPVTKSKPAIRPDCHFVRANSTRTDFLRT